MNMRCDQCRYWKENDGHDWHASSVGFRECVAVQTRWHIQDEATEGIEKYPENEVTMDTDHYDEVGVRWMEAQRAAFAKAKAYVQDGSEYIAELLTGPDFFCALFDAPPVLPIDEKPDAPT